MILEQCGGKVEQYGWNSVVEQCGGTVLVEQLNSDAGTA